MRKWSFAAVLVFLLSLAAIPFRAHAADTVLFRVDSAESLLTLAEKCRLDSYSENLRVTLTQDVDLSGIDFPGIPIFSGNFDGQGHTIRGLTVTTDGSVQGLFRYLTEQALVENLHVEGVVSPGGSAGCVGGIVGHNAGTLTGCSFSGIVSGSESIGGIAGQNSLTGIISNCSSGGTVFGGHFAGGIAGKNAGVIRSCKNTAQVNTALEENQIQLEDITLGAITNTESAAAITDIGGICGTSTGVIRTCENAGNVGYPKVGYNIGGIAGSSVGYVAECVNQGTVQGRKDVGGIVGQLEPAVSMLFEQDALQTLEEQMQTMSNIADSTAYHAESAAGDLKGQLDSLTSEIDNVQNALNTLLPEGDGSQLPDEDTIQAAQNVLSGSMSVISGILSTAGSSIESATNILFKDLNALSGQMDAISQTLNTAQENLGGSIQDVSDADTEEDTTAKLVDCRNLSPVSGDWNIGGIVGTVGPENDLDPESDLILSGSMSANFDLNFRAVIRSCSNAGVITGSKQNIGGIAGLSSMGLVRDCVVRATVDAPGAEYAGGIVGISQGYVRSCSVYCTITADRFVGGIAGEGTTVTECRSFVRLTGTENTGAILGYTDDRSAVTDNFYHSPDTDIGAIDGISYQASGCLLEAKKFFALSGVPDDFDQITVSFRFEDGSIQTVTIPYSHILDPEEIPTLAEKAGFESAWAGTSDLTAPLYFDAEFTAVYTAHPTVLGSDLLAPDGRPRMLAEGDFPLDQSLSVTLIEDSYESYVWSVQLPNSTTGLTLRLLPPESMAVDELLLQLQSADTWQTVSYTWDGSYLVFTPAQDIQSIRLLKTHTDRAPIFVAGTILLCLAIGFTAIWIRRKKKKTK